MCAAMLWSCLRSAVSESPHNERLSCVVTLQRPAQSHKLWWPRDTGLALNTAPWLLIVSSMLAFHKMAQNRIHTTPDWPMSSKLPQMQFDKSQQTTSHTTDTCTHHICFGLHRITNLACPTTPKHPPPSNSRSRRTTPWPPSGRASETLKCLHRLKVFDEDVRGQLPEHVLHRRAAPRNRLRLKRPLARPACSPQTGQLLEQRAVASQAETKTSQPDKVSPLSTLIPYPLSPTPDQY